MESTPSDPGSVSIAANVYRNCIEAKSGLRMFKVNVTMCSDILDSLWPSFDLPKYPKIQKPSKHRATGRVCLADEWIAPRCRPCYLPGSRLDLNKT